MIYRFRPNWSRMIVTAVLLTLFALAARAKGDPNRVVGSLEEFYSCFPSGAHK